MNGIKLGIAGDIELLPANGRRFSISYDSGLIISERAASGLAREQVIARKRVFTIKYSVTTKSNIDRLDYLFNLNQVLILQLENVLIWDQYNVFMAPFSADRYIMNGDGLFEKVNITLRQQ